MLFTPCRAGKSHAHEEWVDSSAIAAAASTILDAIVRLDAQ
jgi:N-carbamoyl-L-amino-acid hydrolase